MKERTQMKKSRYTEERKRVVLLSITHIVSGEKKAEMNIGEA